MYIPADLLKAVALAQAKIDVRLQLHGVCIEPSGHMVATDGHRLHIGYQDVNPHGSTPRIPTAVIVPAETVAIVTKIKARGYELTATLRASPAGGPTLSPRHPASYYWTLGGVAFTPVDAAFPDWRRVIPSDNPDGPLGKPNDGSPLIYNPLYLADVQKAIWLLGVPKKVKGSWTAPEHVRDRTGVLTHADCAKRFCAVVMPMRTAWVGTSGELWARAAAQTAGDDTEGLA